MNVRPLVSMVTTPSACVCLRVNLNWRVQLTSHLLLNRLPSLQDLRSRRRHGVTTDVRKKQEGRGRAGWRGGGVSASEGRTLKLKHVSLFSGMRKVIFL